jgi:hypothetical protein
MEALWCGARPVFADLDPDTLNLSPAAASRAVAAVSARAAVGTAERVVVRTAIGASVRVGLKTMLPAAIIGEAAVTDTAIARGADAVKGALRAGAAFALAPLLPQSYRWSDGVLSRRVR